MAPSRRGLLGRSFSHDALRISVGKVRAKGTVGLIGSILAF
jgi:hypothetical protein